MLETQYTSTVTAIGSDWIEYESPYVGSTKSKASDIKVSAFRCPHE